MAFIILVLLLMALFLIPTWMRSLARRSAFASSNLQLGVFLGFEFCLGLTVFLSFFSSWFSYWVMVDYVIPWATGVVFESEFWESSLTPRGFLSLLILICVPLALFFKVGILAVRDAHQICKEQRDRVRKKHDMSFFWKGF